MKIFVPMDEEGYELAQPVDSADFERFSSQINGVPRHEGWAPIRMKLIARSGQGEPLRDSDAPWLGSDALIFKPRAVQALAPLLTAHGELLPLSCAQASLVVFNPARVLDALDEAASTVWRLPGDGRIVRVEKYVFRPEVIQDCTLFKIKSLRVSPTFLTEEFVNQWNAAGLRGLTFNPVWEG